MSDALNWFQRPHDTIIGQVGYPRYPRVMHCGALGQYEAQIWEGERGFALSVYIEPQRPPDVGPGGQLAAIYGRKVLWPEPAFDSLDEAKARAGALVLAHRDGRLGFEPDGDGYRNVIQARKHEGT